MLYYLMKSFVTFAISFAQCLLCLWVGKLNHFCWCTKYAIYTEPTSSLFTLMSMIFNQVTITYLAAAQS